jgi:hypothetical protein
MKFIQKIILSLCLTFIIVLSISWLAIRFAAPNPTHRWFSSEALDVSPATSSAQKGLQGEYLLAQDLGLTSPTNERSNNAICVCGSQYTGTVPRNSDCESCAVYSADISNFRIPDFVTTTYIAEAKNRFSIPASDSDTLAQITDMVAGARALHIPFYLFVRANTSVDPIYYDLARSTGGDVIQYFVVDAHDTRLILEQAIPNIIIILLAVGAGVLIVGYIVNNLPKRPSHENDEIDDAEQSVEDTEEFMKRMERLSKRSKDEDDKKGKP